MQAWSIASVERDTGLSKELLRMWERRYGFPQPLRDAQGDRLYPAVQVERLRLIKRLLDAGHRPGKLLSLAEGELLSLAQQAESRPDTGHDALLDTFMPLLQACDVDGLRRFLDAEFEQRGLHDFIDAVAIPTLRAVGQAWFEGRLEVHQEHLYTEELQKILRRRMHELPEALRAPRIMLTTLPNELHGLGLLMAEAVLRADRAEVLSFGLQMPVTEIAAAALRHQVHVVGLSVSASFSSLILRQAIAELDTVLPPQMQIWVGGAGVRGMRKLPARVQRFESLQDLLLSLRRWRREH